MTQLIHNITRYIAGSTARRVLAFAVIILLATACEHKPLCWHHPHKSLLKVDFAWWDAPEGPDEVTSMALYIYPHDGSAPSRVEFPGSAGGFIELYTGDYDFVCLNANTETLLYNGTDAHGTFTVSTGDDYILSGMNGRDGDFSDDDNDIKRAEGTYDERVSRQAEKAFGHGITDFNVHGDPGVTQVVTLYPNNLTIHYHIIIENIGCIETISKISGTLSGLAGEVRVHDNNRVGSHNIVPFPLVPTADGTIEGQFVGFGHCPETQSKSHKLAVYAITTEDDHRFFEWDVTEQVHEQDGELYVTIIVTDLDLCGMRDMDLVVDPWIPTDPIVLPMP